MTPEDKMLEKFYELYGHGCLHENFRLEGWQAAIATMQAAPNSKSALKRMCTMNPLDMAERMWNMQAKLDAAITKIGYLNGRLDIQYSGLRAELAAANKKIEDSRKQEPVGAIVANTNVLRPIYENGTLVYPNDIPSKPLLYMKFRGDALPIGTQFYAAPVIPDTDALIKRGNFWESAFHERGEVHKEDNAVKDALLKEMAEALEEAVRFIKHEYGSLEPAAAASDIALAKYAALQEKKS